MDGNAKDRRQQLPSVERFTGPRSHGIGAVIVGPERICRVGAGASAPSLNRRNPAVEEYLPQCRPGIETGFLDPATPKTRWRHSCG